MARRIKRLSSPCICLAGPLADDFNGIKTWGYVAIRNIHTRWNFIYYENVIHSLHQEEV